MSRIFLRLGGLGWKGWVGIGLLVLIAGGAAFAALRRGNGPELTRAERRDVVEVVRLTGSIKPSSAIDLEFISSGRVVARPVEVGSSVLQGALLMAEDGRELDIQIAKARATVEGKKAKLEQLQQGATAETIRQLENALQGKYRDALASLDSAITKADELLSTLRTNVYQANNAVRTDFYLPSDSFTAEAESEKARADRDFALLRNERAAGQGDFASLDALFQKSSGYLDSVRASGVSSTGILRKVVSPAVSQATLSTYVTEVTTARAGLDTSLLSFSAAKAAVETARDNLRVKEEPPRAVDLKILEAEVGAAEADLALLVKQRSDMRLLAPVSGVVTKLGFEVGEMARAGAVAVSLNSERSLEIEVFVPELHVAKIAVGNPVEITFDALSGMVFKGHVIHVDPAETVVEGIVNYKVKIALDEHDSRMKAGSTANLAIETARREKVLALPFASIIERPEGAFVKKQIGEKTEEAPVELGIRGSDGWVEITGGIAEGEEVAASALKN